MMDNQLSVLGHADVQLEGVGVRSIESEDLEGVLWSLKASSPVADAEEAVGVNQFVETTAGVLVLGVEDVGEAEEEEGDKPVAGEDEPQQPQLFHIRNQLRFIQAP